MTSRLLAGAILLVSVLVAWLAISYALAARLLQALVGVSIVYVGCVAFRGWQAMRDPLRAATSGAGMATGDATGRPWVSIVVPARNEAEVIGGAVADLGRQAYADANGPRFDVVIVDDGSTDGTGAQARASAVPFANRRLVERGPELAADSGPPLTRRLDFDIFLAEFAVPPLVVTTAIALLFCHWLLVVPGALLRVCLGPRTVAFTQTPRVGSSRAR